MEVSLKIVGGVAVLTLKGKLDVGEGATMARNAIEGVARSGCVRLVVNLREITHIDTTCLGLLVGAYVRFTKREGGLKLLHTPYRIREVLSMTRLDRILRTFDSEEEAVQSFPVSTEA